MGGAEECPKIMGGAEECPHALLVPSSGQGHVAGGMLLARSLATFGFKVTFVYFSSFYARLKAKNRLVLPDAGPGQEPDPSSQDSNGGAGASSPTTPIEIHVVEDGFAPGDIDQHFSVTPVMKENLFNLIIELRDQGTPPTCLVSDSFVPWTLHVANRAGIPRIDFWSSNAMSYLLITNLPTLFSHGIFPEKGSATKWNRETPLMLDHIPGLPPFSSELCPQEVRFSDSSHPVISFFSEVASCVKYGERILIHTMSEIEEDAFRALEVAGLPSYGIGPLLHYTHKQQEGTPAFISQVKKESGVSQLKEQVDCSSWLSVQADSSVIYIAFGSYAKLSTEEIQELAFGLEASGTPFLWVIREDSQGGTQLLPDGFLERTSKRGMIIGWAPQVEVLAHKAVGGFLTHCGWNSVLESLWEGVPMLCCPRQAEQRLNSHYLCNAWGVGLELGRTDMGGVERRCVELGVKALMQEEEGLQARGKAEEMMQLARNTCQQGGQSFSNLQKFYDDMKALCSKPTSHTSSK